MFLLGTGIVDIRLAEMVADSMEYLEIPVMKAFHVARSA